MGTAYVGGGSGPNWADARLFSSYYNDFTAPYLTDPSLAFFNTGGTNGNAFEAGHPGILTFDTGSGSTNLTRLLTTTRFNLGNGLFEVAAYYKTPAAMSNGTDNFSVGFGLRDSISGTSNDQIIMGFDIATNSGKQYLTKNVAGGGVSVVANGNILPSAATWYRTKIQVNAARNLVNLYTKPFGGAEVLDISYSGTLPASSVGLGVWFALTKTLGSASRVMSLDALQVLETLSAER